MPMSIYILNCYLLLKLASQLVRTRTTMEISSTPIAFCVILGIVIMCNTIILYNMYLYLYLFSVYVDDLSVALSATKPVVLLMTNL